MTEIEKLQKELKKCKIGQWILFGTILMVLLVFFSFPILKIFQPKEITIVNQDGEKYKFSIPSDWIYLKFGENDYGFYDIWDKTDMLFPTFYGSRKNMEEKFLQAAKKRNRFLILRNLYGFHFWEIKKNPEIEEDNSETFFVPELNCFIYYNFQLFQKEQILKKFLSHWKKVE